MQEIERKFLVHSLDFITEAIQFEKIAQGYLNSTPERTVRIRIKNQKGFIVSIINAPTKNGTSIITING